MILIIGANGNMGKRYQAICNYLKIPWQGFDIKSATPNIIEFSYLDTWIQTYQNNQGPLKILICTPTDTHYKIIKQVAKYRLPILCEKPITKSMDELRELLAMNIKLDMILQYRHLISNDYSSYSYYDYFKTGNDGLYWDCLQPIYFSKGKVSIQNKSPIWDCCINGVDLKISNMDEAYVKEIRNWYDISCHHPELILAAHQKVHDYIKEMEKQHV